MDLIRLARNIIVKNRRQFWVTKISLFTFRFLNNHFIIINLKGFGIFFKDSSNEINCQNFDLISDENQSACTVVNSLIILREQEWFKKNDKKKYIIWADSGKHFRNKDLVGYCMQLAQEGITVSLNFFGEVKITLDKLFIFLKV